MKEQNINFTQTEVKALLEVISFSKCTDNEATKDYEDFEDWVGIEMESVEEKLNTFEFKEE